MSPPLIQFAHEWTTPTSIERVWTLLSDTDRFNRMIGSGSAIHRETDEHGRTRHVGLTQRLGMQIRWIEQPRQFLAPHWLHDDRRLSSGPLSRLRTTLTLEESEGGTLVRYHAALTPRHILLWPVLFVESQRLSAAMHRAISAALAHLRDPEQPYEPPVPSLSTEASGLLSSRMDQIEGPIRAHLDRFVRHAPAYRQTRISPLWMARLWGLTEDEAIEGLLAATRAGVLTLSWELLCPNCRGREAVVQTVPDGPVDAHCGSCNIRYDGAFLDACAVSFATVPEIRASTEPPACLMHPARTPHVLARDQVAAMDTLRWSVDLKPGLYRIESDAMDGAGTLEVLESAPAQPPVFTLTERGMAPQRLRTHPGPQVLTVRSQVAHSAWMHLQDRSWPETILTAGRLLERKDARAWLPPGAIAPGLQVVSRRGAVLAVESLRGMTRELLGAALKSFEPDRLQIGPRRALALWHDPAQALDAAVSLTCYPALTAGLSVGAVLEIGEVAIGGRAAALAREAARSAGAGRVVLDPQTRDAPEFQARLSEISLDPYQQGNWALAERSPADPEDQDPVRPGERFGDFVVAHRLDRGGFGEVLAATHIETGAPAAIKVLLPELAARPAYVERFYIEAKTTAALTHPGIVRVLDWGFNGRGRLYLAMDRLLGHLLSEEIEDNHGIAAERAVTIAIALLEVLDEAHANGIVHCDVKPNNVVLAQDPSAPEVPHLRKNERVTLLDFGVASPIRTRFAGSHAQGTPAYMSPEQRFGTAIDTRTDLYAVGLLITDCVIGTIPQEPLQDALRLPLWLRPTVERALASDVEARWPTAAAMAQALADALARWEASGPASGEPTGR